MPRGMKTCPRCEKQSGPRTKTCECGYVFIADTKRKQTTQVEKPFEALSETPPEVVGIKDCEALDSFIRQLKSCRDDSRRTGGCYSAFLHSCNGVTRVEVWLKMETK